MTRERLTEGLTAARHSIVWPIVATTAAVLAVVILLMAFLAYRGEGRMAQEALHLKQASDGLVMEHELKAGRATLDELLHKSLQDRDLREALAKDDPAAIDLNLEPHYTRNSMIHEEVVGYAAFGKDGRLRKWWGEREIGVGEGLQLLARRALDAGKQVDGLTRAGNLPVLAQATPVYFQKELVGVLTVCAGMEVALEGLATGLGADVQLSDAEGNRLLSFGDPFVPSQTSGSGARLEVVKRGAQAFAVSYTPLLGVGDEDLGSVAIRTEMTPFVQGRERSIRNMALTALVVFVVGSVLVAVLLLRRMRPLHQVVAAIQEVAGGNLDTHVNVAGDDEVGQLGTAFNQMAENLRRSTSALEVKAALDGASANVMVADRDGTITYANGQMLESVTHIQKELSAICPGFSAASLVGRNLAEFHKDSPEVRRIIDDHANLPYQGKVRLGARSWEVAVSAVIDDHGEYVATVMEWTDITERSRMEEEIAALVDGVNAGHLDRRIAPGQFERAEYCALAERLNAMLTTITEPLTRIRDACDQVAQSAAEIASGNQDLANRTQQQAASVDQNADSAEQIAALVRSSADNANHADELAVQAFAVAEQGEAVIRKAVAAMAAINQSSTRIRDIIEVIDEIAFQTNLLSLNAAVEAARAGEHGRGFAVVAAEVRNLARRSAKAAQEIKELIQDSVGKVAAGTDLVNASGESLHGLLESVRQVSTVVRDIATAATEQRTSVDSINAFLGEINVITQKNAALVEEVAAAAQTLTGRAQEMNDDVTRFHLA
jgi:methyl-accepting chemotaxis protein